MTGIRSAAAGDAAAMAELRWEFRAGRQAPTEDHDAFVTRCAAWMREELTSARWWRAWVAIAGGEVVGQIWVCTIQKIPNPIAELETHAYISNLYVRPSARGGVGTRLLNDAIDWAESNQIDRLVLWPSPQSVTLYLRHGFSRGGDVMERKL
jgi:GNAT superfamily N-acetyltransferase